MEGPKGVENEMSDYGKIEGEEYAGIGNAV